jgi:hypothetical protein
MSYFTFVNVAIATLLLFLIYLISHAVFVIVLPWQILLIVGVILVGFAWMVTRK